MPDAPLSPPAPQPPALRPAASPARAWLAHRPAGAIAVALGVIAFVAAALAQPGLWAMPDARLTVPGLVATAAAAAISIARRERAHALWLAGLGLAAAAIVLGWFLMFAIVIGATVLVMLILHSVM